MNQEIDSGKSIDKFAFGNRIFELRRKLGLSQMKLAEITNLSNNTISSYETGKQLCNADNLNHLADALKTTVDYLLYGLEGNDENSEEQELEKLMNREWQKLNISDKRKFLAMMQAFNETA